MIVRAKVVVTMDGPPIENGAIVVSEDRILDVGKASDIRKRHSGEEIVDLAEQALLPGLINAHCHLDYTCLRGKIAPQESFTDWIRAINAEKTKLLPDDYIASINEGFAEAKRFGTTTIANLTGFSELVSRIEAPIRTWWFAELIDLRRPVSKENLNALCIQLSGATEHWGLAPHAPFTASPELYRKCAEITSLLTTHLAESREEMAMFRDGEGELYQFLKEIGRDMSDCGKGTPVALFVEQAAPGRTGTSNRPYLLVHLNELSSSDFDLLKKSERQFSIVHCPRSHAYFKHSPFQFGKLRDLGRNVCLGTDSLASNDDLSLFGEMRAFQKEFPFISAEDILKMVTVNPARALGEETRLGKIRAGFLADSIAVPLTKSTSVFDEIVAFDRPVSWSMAAGRVST